MAISRKTTSFYLFGFVILGLNSLAVGQLHNRNSGEIIDINPASRQMNQINLRLEKYRMMTDSLSRYPEERVTYVFNGKPSDTIYDARRRLFTNLDYMESLATSEHDQGDKRFINVRLRPH